MSNTPYPTRQDRVSSPIADISNSSSHSDFSTTIQRYNEAISLEPNNARLYCSRSSVYTSTGYYKDAIQDANTAISMQPNSAAPYYRLGQALKYLDQYDDAIAALCQSLIRDSNSSKILNQLLSLVLSGKFGNYSTTYGRLKEMGAEGNPFVIISSIGNEFINVGNEIKAVEVLEAARSIPTDKMKVKSTLLFSLSDLYWSLEQYESSISCIKENLQITTLLDDKASIQRCCLHLGNWYARIKHLDKAEEMLSQYVNISLSLNDFRSAAFISSSLGHAYSANKMHELAYPWHVKSAKFAHEIKNKQIEAKENCLAGCALFSSGKAEQSLPHHHEHLRLAKELDDKDEEMRALSNLGQACFIICNYQESLDAYKSLFSVSTNLKSADMMTRAYGGMGKTYQAMCLYDESIDCFVKQLHYSRQQSSDPNPQTKAMANLAHTYELSGNSIKSMHSANELLVMCQKHSLKSLEARAYSILGKNNCNLGNYREAINLYDLQLALPEGNNNELRISSLVNVAFCYNQLGSFNRTESYYSQAIALADTQNCSKEARLEAYEAYGEYLLRQSRYEEALSKFEECLSVSKTPLNVTRSLGKNLAYCYEKLGNFEQAIYYYQEMFLSGKDENLSEQMVEACNKLAQLYRVIGDVSKAFIYEKKGLGLESDLLNGTDSNSSYINMEELNKRAEHFLNNQQFKEAITFYLELRKKAQIYQAKMLEACSLAGLGKCYDKLGQRDEAIKCYLQEILIRKEISDNDGEANSLERLGEIFYKTAEYSEAKRYFQSQLLASKRADSKALEVTALGNMGKVLMKTQKLDEAIECFNLQLTIYDEDTNIGTTQEHAECCANLGDIYIALNKFQEALSSHTKHLALVQQINQPHLQIRAYGSIGKVHFGLGQLDDALMCYEKKQIISRKVGSKENEMEVYGELASVHKIFENWNQAISCYKHQRDMAKKMIETVMNNESTQRFYCQALHGLSEVHYLQQNYDKAFEYQKKCLDIVTNFSFKDMIMDCNEMLADIHEKLHDYQTAISFREAELVSGREMDKTYHICKGLMGLGKCQFYRCDFTIASRNLREALTVAYSLDFSYLEAKIRYYLGLVYFHLGEMESAQISLNAVRPIIDTFLKEMLYMSYSRLVELLHMQENIFLTLELVFASQDKPLDALVMADTKKMIHFAKHTIFRYKVEPEVLQNAGFFKNILLASDISRLVMKIPSHTVVYSVAYDKLHIWLLHNGLVTFQQIDLTEYIPTHRKLKLSSQISLTEDFYLFTDFYPGLADLVNNFRESIGISSIFCPQKIPLSPLIPFMPLCGLNYSETSSVTQNSVSSGSSKRSAPNFDYLPSMDVCQQRLYRILIEPIEKFLPPEGHRNELTFILDRDLLLVPFSLLSSSDVTTPPLYEQYKLHFYLTLQNLLQVLDQVIPPIRSNTGVSSNNAYTIHSKNYKTRNSDQLNLRKITQGLTLKEEFSLILTQNLSPPLVVASPHFLHINHLNESTPKSWFMKPAAEKEARRVAAILKTKAIMRSKATRKAILDELQKTDCVFYSGQIQWNLLRLIQPSELPTQTDKLSSKEADLKNASTNLNKLNLTESGASKREESKAAKSSNVSDFSALTINDLLKSDLSKIKLFSISGHCLAIDNSSIDINDYTCFIYSLLLSGIRSIFIPLWSINDNSARAFIMSFFNSTANGMRLSRAFRIAIKGLKNISCFAHPIFWSGFTVVGQDVVIHESNHSRNFHQLISLAPPIFRNILTFLRDIMVEADSLMVSGVAEPTIVPESDVIQDFADIHCWKDILEKAGFLFLAGLPPDIPRSIMYPEHDDASQLKLTISYTEALLNLDSQIISYFRRLRNREIIIYPLLRLFKLTLMQFDNLPDAGSTNNEIMLNLVTEVYVWGVLECQELLNYIGFTLKLATDTQTEVQLEIPGHLVNPTQISYYITSLHALFGTEDKLPKIILDSHKKDNTL